LVSGLSGAAPLDLSKAVAGSPAGLSGPEKKAVTLPVEEVEKRSQFRLQNADV
jgi:hypothetical protein